MLRTYVGSGQRDRQSIDHTFFHSGVMCSYLHLSALTACPQWEYLSPAEAGRETARWNPASVHMKTNSKEASLRKRAHAIIRKWWDKARPHGCAVMITVMTGKSQGTEEKANINTKLQAHLPWRLSGKESACQCRKHGFNPWSGKIAHAAEQLSPSATTTEPVL